MARSRSKPAPRKDPHRVGRRIRVREVRVIGADGGQLGILPTQEALRLAEEADLQLVEVNAAANPPVCKIMDYGKFKYEVAKRDRDTKRTKKSQELKEVKFRPKTHTHDFDFKVKHARRFLEDGHKVRLSIQFRGREVVHPETGKDVLERVCEVVDDVASVHQPPRMEGKRMSMILAPRGRKDGQQGKAQAAKAPAAAGSKDRAPSPKAEAKAPAAENSAQAAPEKESPAPAQAAPATPDA